MNHEAGITYHIGNVSAIELTVDWEEANKKLLGLWEGSLLNRLTTK
jgi:hypothetical protein